MTIKKLPIKNKREGEKDLFLVKSPAKCSHYKDLFEIDADAGKGFCRECGGEVTLMFILDSLMQVESRWMRSHERYKDEMKRLSNRSRTKCDHCKKITRISLR